MRNIFLEKSYTRSGGEASPRLWYKNSQISGSQSDMLKDCFYFMSTSS